MKRITARLAYVAAGAIIITILAAMSVPAGVFTRGAIQQEDEYAEGLNEAREAARVFREIMNKPDQAIPRELLENATGIAIFPDVLKAAFIIGGRAGDGIVMRKDKNGRWAAPVFYELSGASFGPQIGGKSTDHILLFMNEGALRELEDDKLEFGGDLSFAAGPVGRTVAASTNLKLDSGILTWSRSEGAFVGASLKGAVLTADNETNKAIYGERGGTVLRSSDSTAKAARINELNDLRKTIGAYSGSETRNAGALTADKPEGTRVRFINSNLVLYPEFEPAQMNRAELRSDPAAAATVDLARRIRTELLTLPYYSIFDWIEFEVHPKGVVILKGLVTTPPNTRSRAEKYVEEIPGVTNVVNEIGILPVSLSDDRIRRAVYREIYSGPLFRYQIGSLQSIHIIVNNGRVTLEGVVDSLRDKDLAGTKARSVPGIFGVTNHLKVRPDEATP